MFSKENEKLLIEAFDLYIREKSGTYPSKNELENISFSNRFEEKMSKLIKRQKKFYYNMVNTSGKRTASIIVAILTCLIIATVSVGAIREPIVQFIVETYEKFSNISVDKGDMQVSETFEKTEPEYIPDGFERTVLFEDELMYELSYKKDTGEVIVYYQCKIDETDNYSVDTEGVKYKDVKVNGRDGILFTNKGEAILVFANESCYFEISGTITEDEALKIAKSIPML